MRTSRIVILAAFLVTSVTICILSLRSKTDVVRGKAEPSSSAIRGLLSFGTPLSLFPPNAIISLTDDNTTSFLARPAAFGPLLPQRGLSGQLWIGSGFGDDSLRQGIISSGAEGELGCSDVPGWDDGTKNTILVIPAKKVPGETKSKISKGKAKNEKRDDKDSILASDRTAAPVYAPAGKESERIPSANDGTDDHLHHPLPNSKVPRPNQPGHETHGISTISDTNHADIQSIQEGAEIAGKIVLLSRGGCGFLEKVKWVQRRGGVALIVGDDTRGGPLIQMYARGDTSNVTIPSIFTSHTTAHLLSSLIPPGSFIEDTIDENGQAAVKVQQSKKPKKGSKKGSKHGSSTKSAYSTSVKGFVAPRPTSKSSTKSADSSDDKSSEIKKSSWLGSVFSKSSSKDTKDNLPGSKSGRLDWVLVDDWDENEPVVKAPIAKDTSGALSAKKPPAKQNSSPKVIPEDDFVIGVQDWRDPDLVGVSDDLELAQQTKSSSRTSVNPNSNIGEKGVSQKGGSITPGSGEYVDGVPIRPAAKELNLENVENKAIEGDKSGLLSKIFGEDEDESESFGKDTMNPVEGIDDDDNFEDDEDDHEGLWVTLTQTSGATPFFDTLLVLVVSPLVTLSVVYALLLLRSRIRRRRWRAPKSVVERLPVRTYQTVVSSTHSRQPSPTSSSPSTPLLQRPRPRSRTTSGLPEPGNLSRANSDTLQPPRVPSRGHEHEKPAHIASEWKKYMGKQVECVVCLEEYVDGISRVMSLPCGHEFHVDCITPWLTTRRRTCPICKGDVVRSLARASSSSPRYEAYRDDNDDDVRSQISQILNESSAEPITIVRESDDVDNDDPEQGIISPTPSRPRRGDRSGSWRSVFASSLGSMSRSPRPPVEDRTR